MELLAPTMPCLFAQLGEANDAVAIARFIERNGTLWGGTHMYEASCWSRSQAAFLRDAIAQDANWAPIVDELNALFHRAHPSV
ncbi:DUF2789 family protein [Rhodoferax sp. GW822-FHT02A01]|uniref:DUF2789 family protein n=1 Tax=Rhodoferax sp. GW822-FHT02A01 TaxID=3141537 RepID=UPI00315D90DD